MAYLTMLIFILLFSLLLLIHFLHCNMPLVKNSFFFNFSAAESKVTSVNHQDLTFTLNLVRSDKTYNNPEQQWTFVSNYAVTDYSGDYQISLLPCTVAADQTYSEPQKCKFKDPLHVPVDLLRLCQFCTFLQKIIRKL